MRKYCAMDYVFLVTVKGRAQSSDPEWSQFRVEVEKPYKKPPRGKKASRGLRLRRGKKIMLKLIFLCPLLKMCHLHTNFYEHYLETDAQNLRLPFSIHES